MNINSINEETAPSKSNQPIQDETTIPYLAKWNELDTQAVYFEDQYTLIREVRLPISTKHGAYTFAHLSGVIDRWQSFSSSHPLSAKGKGVEDLLFFDTETTGLSNGAGNRIFLLGSAQIIGDEVIVRQYFLPGPEAEVAFYHHFLTDVGAMKNLVTYNGKAFDWPQVKTRHTFVRDQVPMLPKFGHFDLLHASRRLWKEQLSTCKLSTVEKEILQFERVSDTPGYMAPMLYFDFLHEQDPAFVQGIIQHHEWDVLSLITLYIDISERIFKALEKQIANPIESYKMARWFDYIGEREIAMPLYEKLQEIESVVQLKSKWAYAQILKQNKQLPKAEAVFNQLLIVEEEFVVESAVELAKIAEHHHKDYDKALDFSNKAYQLFSDRKYVNKNKDHKMEVDIIKRVERLQRKSSK